MPKPRVREKRGVALMAVLLVTLAIVAIVIVASTTTLNARLISQNSERSTALYNVAQAGIEEVRNTLNTHPGDPTYFKDSGEVMVEDHVPVLGCEWHPSFPTCTVRRGLARASARAASSASTVRSS